MAPSRLASVAKFVDVNQVLGTCNGQLIYDEIFAGDVMYWNLIHEGWFCSLPCLIECKTVNIEQNVNTKRGYANLYDGGRIGKIGDSSVAQRRAILCQRLKDGWRISRVRTDK